MAIRDLFKVTRKTFVNPSAWLDYQMLRNQTVFMYTLIKSLFRKEEPERKETFEQAMKRFNLHNKDVAEMRTTYRVYAAVLFLLGLVSVTYCFYLLIYYQLKLAFWSGLCVSLIFFAQAFRYDFWALQLSKRKLGCTFEEWCESWVGKRTKND